jgi:hypothetical protein
MAARKSVGGEHLEVAVDLGIELGAVNHRVRVGDSRVIFSTEKGLRRMYWAKSSRSALASGGTGSPAWRLKPLCLPGVEDLDAFPRQELLLDQEIDDLGAEEFFQRLERRVWQGVEVEG